MQFHKLQDFSKLLSCAQAEKYYQVSRTTVLLWCKRGKIKNCALTRHGYLVDPDEVAALWPKREQ